MHVLELETKHGEILRRESESLPEIVEASFVSVKPWTRPIQMDRMRFRFKKVEGCKYKEIET